MKTRTQSGFSLVELMVAMTVTLIVSAAIYGLLASGSNAFRREPEVADRQQNIRVAMDLISRDVFNAGAALPPFAQVFTVADPAGGGCTGALGVNGCGEPGTLGAAAAAARAPGDSGDPSTDSDVLELVSTAENCPVRTVCSGTAGSAGVFVTREPMGDCVMASGLAVVTNNAAFAVQPAFAATGAPQTCTGIGANGNVTLGSVVAPWAPVVAIPANPTPFLYGARVVRYRIAPSTDPTDPAPALWRSSSGRYASDGTVVLEPDQAGFPDLGSPWELVARGIEDLQIEYRAGDGLWRNLPPQSVVDDWTTLVREVRITLSARVSAVNLQGETTAQGGPDAIRGQLTTVVAPRAAFNELQMGGQIQ
jgi:prepilin-type N-terminal cleavage/methylation domain-containing protein